MPPEAIVAIAVFAYVVFALVRETLYRLGAMRRPPRN